MSTPEQIGHDMVTALHDLDPDEFCDCVHPDAVMQAKMRLDAGTGMDGAADIFAILGDPTRVRVLTALRAGELCVADLAAVTGVNRTTVSHQLRVLRANRLVRRRREGKVVFYAIADDHVEILLDVAMAHAMEEAARPAEVPA